jgi:hypothetical protein
MMGAISVGLCPTTKDDARESELALEPAVLRNLDRAALGDDADERDLKHGRAHAELDPQHRRERDKLCLDARRLYEERRRCEEGLVPQELRAHFDVLREVPCTITIGQRRRYRHGQGRHTLCTSVFARAWGIAYQNLGAPKWM